MQKPIGMIIGIIAIVAALAAGAFFGSTLDVGGGPGDTPAADAERNFAREEGAGMGEHGAGFGQPVGESLDQDRLVVVPRLLALGRGFGRAQRAKALGSRIQHGARVIEDPEICDDGNFVAGDGCSPDCLSDETCGNGIIDFGETCEDGDLQSHDGCSSGCTTENTTWRAVTTADATPPQMYGNRMALTAGGALVGVSVRRSGASAARAWRWPWT